ncbi:hypothetical protein WAF17_10940 [Bernardetia sp. ABR2-2B]|uniref:hypothetical protein n=1 Tax=Bernardetia sp. ABR2-2B TaxID=3127472 RepID=UPI0030CBECC1
MNLNKFKKFALTTKKTQKIAGGSEPYTTCYDAATGETILVPLSQVGNYPHHHCLHPFG